MAPVFIERHPDVAVRGARGDLACVDRIDGVMAGAGSKRQVQSQLCSSAWLVLSGCTENRAKGKLLSTELLTQDRPLPTHPESPHDPLLETGTHAQWSRYSFKIGCPCSQKRPNAAVLVTRTRASEEFFVGIQRLWRVNWMNSYAISIS